MTSLVELGRLGYWFLAGFALGLVILFRLRHERRQPHGTLNIPVPPEPAPAALGICRTCGTVVYCRKAEFTADGEYRCVSCNGTLDPFQV